jgi:hypothetical protein
MKAAPRSTGRTRPRQPLGDYAGRIAPPQRMMVETVAYGQKSSGASTQR